MISRTINYCGQTITLACDAQCHKAWGINGRPRVQISVEEDDYAFLADHELGMAPVNPGTYEGGHGKPQEESQRLNKWCARECERSCFTHDGNLMEIPDFDERVYNIDRA